MKAALSIFLMSCLALGILAQDVLSQATKDSDAVKQALATLINLQLKYDANGVDKMLDREFVYVSNDGSEISREEFLRLTNRETNPLDLLEVTDVNVRIPGDTAIATGTIHEKGLLNGKPYEFRGRSLLTYVRMSGRWLCLAIHD